MTLLVFNFLIKILKMAYPEMHSTKFMVSNYKIIAQEFSSNSNETLFKICRRGKKDYMLLTARSCAANKRLISQMSQEDAYLIGYSLGSETVCKYQQTIATSKPQTHLL